MKAGLLAIVILACPLAIWSQNLGAYNGQCSKGGQAVVTQGLPSVGTVPLTGGTVSLKTGAIGSFPSCTVSVYLTGTGTLVTQLYADAAGSVPISNPFTANVDGSFLFFANQNTGYDVTLSAGGLPASVALTDVVPGTVINTIAGAQWVDGGYNATVAQAIGRLPGSGGIVYIPPGSYACPSTPPPSNVSLISLSAGADATVAALGFDGIVSGLVTQVKFTNCPQWTLTSEYNTRIEGITLDFANTGAGVSFIDSQWHHWKHVTLLNCGNTTTPCLQLLSNGGGSPSFNTALNVFDDLVINPNTSGGQFATCVLFQGSTSAGSSTVTQNNLVRPICAGNILVGFEFETNTDTNTISNPQLYQQGIVANSHAVMFNSVNPAADVDADNIHFLGGFSITGPFTSSIYCGKSISNDIAAINGYTLTEPGGQCLTDATSSPFPTGYTTGRTHVMAGQVVATSDSGLVAPSAGTAGDITAVETSSTGKLFLGNDTHSLALFRNSTQMNFGTDWLWSYSNNANQYQFIANNPSVSRNISVNDPVGNFSLQFALPYTLVLSTSSLNGNTCRNETVSASGASTITRIVWSFASTPIGVTGWGDSPGLSIKGAFGTTNTANVVVCNNTSSPITPQAMSLLLTVLARP